MSDNEGHLRVGVIGCGRVAEARHLPALGGLDGARVVALADTDAARLEALGRAHGVARLHKDHRALLDEDGIDAVAVCTPPRFHAEAVLAALEAGKHVLVEKPLALDLEECDLLVEAARARPSLKVMVGFNLRWHRLVRGARDVVRRGDLGPFKMARTVLTSGVRKSPDFPDWRTRRETGGGALFELGVHHLDLLRFVTGGEVEEVSAMGASGEETTALAARMSGGALVTAAFCERTGESHEIEIFGEDGWLRIACHRADGLERFGATDYAGSVGVRLKRAGRTIRELPQLLKQARQGGDYLASYRAEWRHFVESVRDDREPECTLEDGRRATEAALAAVESDAQGRAVKVRAGRGATGESLGARAQSGSGR